MRLNKVGTVTFLFENTAGTEAYDKYQTGNFIIIFH